MKFKTSGIYVKILMAIIIITGMIYSVSAQEKEKVSPDKKESIKIEYVDNDLDNNENKDESRTIIISADRIKKDLIDIPLAASVVDKQKIEERVYTTMADLLSDMPGFTQVYEYHSPLILRGSTGNKMLILRNGHPRFSSSPGGFMGQNVNVYDIERVEVVRGPGSVIYGSGATSGIINIIEKDIFEEKGLHLKVGGAYGINDSSRMVINQMHWNNDPFAILVSGRYRKADNMYYGNGVEALNSFHEDKDVSMKMGYKFNDKNRIVLNSSFHFGGPWGKPYGFNNKQQIFIENDNDDTYHFSATYNGEKIGIFDKIIFSGFYDYETRDYHKQKVNSTLDTINFDEIVNYEDQYGGGYALGVVSFDSHQFSIGANGYVFRIWSPGKTIDYYNYSIPTETDKVAGAEGAGTTSVGVFLQDHWRIDKSFAFIGGVRYDIASVVEGDNPAGDKELIEKRKAVSGNAGLVYKTSSSSSLTFNLGRAFRMPDSMDMFTERATCAGTLSPNPNLDPEYSWNLDAGYKGRHKEFYWDLALFSNYYNNLIIKVPNPDDPSGDIKDNEEKARLMGGEVSLAYRFKDFINKGMHLKPGVTAAFYRGDSFSNRGNPWQPWSSADALSGIPPVKIKLFLRYVYMSDVLNYFFEMESDTSLKKIRLPEEESESPWNNEDINAYTLLNITTGVKFFEIAGFEEMKINIRMQNLLDIKYYSFGSHIPGKGRDFKIFVSAEY